MKMLRFRCSAANPERVGWWTLCLLDYNSSIILRSLKPLQCQSNNTCWQSRPRRFRKSLVDLGSRQGSVRLASRNETENRRRTRNQDQRISHWRHNRLHRPQEQSVSAEPSGAEGTVTTTQRMGWGGRLGSGPQTRWTNGRGQQTTR